MAEILKLDWEKDEIYCLKNNGLEAYINPNDGMNLVKLCYHELEVISYSKERAKQGATYGIPILFPTPNRTKDNRFVFEGKEYCAKMHGIARNEAFCIIKQTTGEKTASLIGELNIEQGTTLYKQFPFVSTLQVEIQLLEDAVRYQYQFKNRDGKSIPFGFGLHPFFNNLNKEAIIAMSAKKIMKKKEDFLPTGEVIDVGQTPYDLSQGKIVANLDLDDVYTDIENNRAAILTFKEFQIIISMGHAFSHMVVYTPKNETFFCVEPQTCSTDAINLYHCGKEKESGLIIVKPKETVSGEVLFKIR